MEIVSFMVLIIGGGFGIFLQFRSFSFLSENITISQVLVMGPFAKREYFTEKGWKYWKRGIIITLFCGLISMIMFIISFY
ncbi:MAG TPA: hypothetical protein PK595_02005 [Bacteroidota bacterium]|jgi:hypothetical protein|nr:hypothetical protein [Bacteroidota bacterium]